MLDEIDQEILKKKKELQSLRMQYEAAGWNPPLQKYIESVMATYTFILDLYITLKNDLTKGKPDGNNSSES